MWDHWMCGPQCCAKFMNIIDFGRDGCAYFFFLKHSLLKISSLHSTAAEQLQNWQQNWKLQDKNLEESNAQFEHSQSRGRNGLLIPPWSLGHIQNSPSSSLSPLPDFPEITDHAHSHVYSYFCWIGILVHKPVILQISFSPVLSLKMVWSLYTHAKK